MDKYVGSSLYSTSVAGMMMVLMMMMIVMMMMMMIITTIISSVLNARFMELLTGFRPCEVIKKISSFSRY